MKFSNLYLFLLVSIHLMMINISWEYVVILRNKNN
jgi:hypothetical protein